MSLSRGRRGVQLLGIVLLIATSCGSDGIGADAGDDMTVKVGEAPVFDGCGSTGDVINYSWTVTDAPASRSADVGKALRETNDACSFTLESAMVVDEVGDWTIELEVSDGDANAQTDSVKVEVVE